MLFYDSLEQTRMRLANSVVTTEDGRAFFVRDAHQKRGSKKIQISGQFYPLFLKKGETEGEAWTFEVDDPAVNFRLFRVGYINADRSVFPSRGHQGQGQALYVVRDTTRQQLQGLTRRSCTISGNPINDALFMSSCFENMLMNRYPTPEEASRLMSEDGWTSCAVSRDFAIGTDPKYPGLKTLMYRDDAIGLALGKNKVTFQVDTDKRYLKEVLELSGFPFTFTEE